MNIGLVEDNPSICECVTFALKLVGHRVNAYTTGESLLKVLSSASLSGLLPYDMLIVDLHLPGRVSGQDVLTVVRSTAATQQLPVLIISGTSEDELARIRARFPSIPILRKPFELQTLVRCVNQYARRNTGM